VACHVTGQQIVGSQRTTSRWAKLSTGGYVSDAFLAWSTSREKVPNCADGGVPTARVIGGIALNVRTGPGTNYKIVSRLAPGMTVPAGCRAWGQRIAGEPVWYRIGTGRYVSGRFVRWTPSQPQLPWCGQAAGDKPATSNAAFIARTAPPAQASMRKYRVPASVTVAQAILESGWGRSALAAKDHNYFGMKCFGGPGGIAIGCRTYATRECDGSRCFAVRDSFRVYRTAADSFADHGKQLATLARYKKAMKYARDPNRFATEIHKAGYATSPTYAKSLIAIMKQFKLYRYDAGAKA
jgi:flagellar protein FlgJ